MANHWCCYGGKNPLNSYWPTLNAYASRANYTMQLGSPSADVAVYKPMLEDLAQTAGFGSDATPISTINVLQSNGLAWDMINDDTIINGLVWEGGELIANGNTRYDALVVEAASVPLETLKALQTLRSAGAPIYFHETPVSSQPGYADGAYTDLDAQAVAIFQAMGGLTSTDTLVTALKADSTAAISYATNDSVRFNRRSLDEGAELAYFRNTSADSATTLTAQVADASATCFWLDLEQGTIHKSDVENSTANATLEANGAVVLLCQPAGSAFSAEHLSAGLPDSITTFGGDQTLELADFTLEVTADNIGAKVPSVSKSQVFGEDGGSVLGDWTSSDFLDGQLACVTNAGTYRTSFNVSNVDEIREGGAVLDLGSVGQAVTVRVNSALPSALTKQLTHSPFRVDIAEALVSGENTIEIEVQPAQNNRRVCLKQAYATDPVANAKYIAYASTHGSDQLMPAGLMEPVVLRTVTPVDQSTPTFAPSVEVDPERVEQGAAIIIKGSGFAPEVAVDAVFYSDPVTIGSAVADEDGSVTFTFTIPTDADLGAHRVVLSQADPALSAEARVTVIVSGNKASDGAGSSLSDEAKKSSTKAKKASGKSGSLAATGLTTAVILAAAAITACAGGISLASRKWMTQS